MTSPLTLPYGHADAASDQFAKQLGRLVLASTHLETTCADIARAMCVDPTRGIEDALLDVERRARVATPPWVRLRGEDLARWSEYARRLLGDRQRLFAALPDHRFTGSDGDAPRVRAADGSVFPADERYLDRTITRTHRHDTVGADLRLRLEYVDPKGASWPIGRWHLEAATGADPAILDRLAQLPVEWRAWLDAEVPAAAPAA